MQEKRTRKGRLAPEMAKVTGSRKTMRKYGTDRIAFNLRRTLIGDFRSSLGKDFLSTVDFNGSAKDWRAQVLPSPHGSSPAIFKRIAQMDNLLKKYRFAEDLYTDEQLHKLSLRKYFSEQERIMSPRRQSLTTMLVLQEARLIVKQVLGDLDPEEIVDAAKFGSKSSIGCPFRLAYLDYKLSDKKAFSGSKECIDWFFREYLYNDEMLARIISPAMGRFFPSGEDHSFGFTPAKTSTHESLALVTVPKTWKTLRLITPLTLLSLFYSNGLGKVIKERLKDYGLDIGKLQHQHRRLVKTYSRTRTHVTADLSAASDSISRTLLMQLLPRKWYRAVRKVLTHRLIVDGKPCYTASVLPMGNGVTFPLETLVFYSLIKAIGTLSKTRGTYSVYGDDLIYPTEIHGMVEKVFSQVGFVMNSDKTFVHHDFRESCGADYYRGADVRSYYFKGQSRDLTRSRYAAELYKAYNGLSLRWDPLEIPGTLHWILTELSTLGYPLLRVPPSYPDTAGIKVAQPGLVPQNCHYADWHPIKTSFTDGSRWWSFLFFDDKPFDRHVIKQEVYCWKAIRGLSSDDERPDTIWDDASPEEMSWRKITRKETKQRGSKRIVRTVDDWVPVVPSKDGAAIVTRASEPISDWI